MATVGFKGLIPGTVGVDMTTTTGKVNRDVTVIFTFINDVGTTDKHRTHKLRCTLKHNTWQALQILRTHEFPSANFMNNNVNISVIG